MNIGTDDRINGKIVKSAKAVHLCSSVAFFVCGLLIMLVPDFERSVGIFFVGAVSIVIGGAGIYGYFSNDMYRLAFQSDFALGIFNVILGALLMANPVRLEQLLPCAVGILAILDGGNKSQISIEGFHFGMRKWYLVALSAVAELALGIAVILVALSGEDVRICMGITMVAVGVINFWTTMYTVRVRKEKNNREYNGGKTE